MNKRKALLERSNAIRSVLKALRKNKEPNTPFLNEDGAIDTGSIMIAVLVLGIVAGLVASTVFVVIPWAQDNAAKQQLKSVMAAQQVYAGMATLAQLSPNNNPSGSIALLDQSMLVPTGNVDPTSYGTLSDLIGKKLFDPAFLPPNSADLIYGEQVLSPDKSLCVITLDSGKGYEAAVRSQSGHIFVTNDGWVGPIQIPDTEPICRGRVLGDYANYVNNVANGQPTPTASPLISPAPDPTEPAGEVILTTPLFTPTPTATASATASATPTPTLSATVTPSATTTPATTSTPVATATATASPKPDPIPDAPAVNKDPNTKTFMFCHMGSMHSNSFNGMVNGHQGHTEDIMPPIPPRNYVGWNWNAKTAKTYYNNCIPTP